MGASLSLTIKETEVSQANNSSKITVSVSVKSTGGTSNSSSRAGTIVIDGTSYKFSHGFAANTTTKLATKSKTVKHNTDGTKTITVKATYKTGTSAGNLSVSKSFTLTSVKRQFKVTLNSGTSTTTLTKQYGTNLTLSTPAKTGYTFGGWCTAVNGGGTNYKTTYTANADVTLYAKWTINSYALTANINSTTGSIPDTAGWTVSGLKATKSITYGSQYGVLPSPIRKGYTFEGWYTAASGGEELPSPSTKTIGTSNVTIYAHWEAKQSRATYDGNDADEGSVPYPATRTYTYDQTCEIPENSGNLTKKYYIFKGWSTNKDAVSPQYLPGEPAVWQNDAEQVTLYAVWAPDTVKITYYRNSVERDFSSADSYIELQSLTFEKKDQTYQVENIEAPNLLNYIFSGKWTLNKPNNVVYTEYGVSFPAGVIPLDYDIASLTLEDGFFGPGDSIYNVTEPLNFYPVYKDNTNSLVSLFNTTYNYIPNNVDESTYFAYVSDQLSIIPLSTIDTHVITCCIFRTEPGASGVSLDLSGVSAELKSKTNTPIPLNPVFMRSVYNTALDISTIYVIYRNTQDGVLENYEDTDYILTVTGIEDSFGKSVSSATVNIYPPKVLRDINKKGDVIAFFTNAPDYSGTLEEKELLINGNIMLGLYNYNKNSTLDKTLYTTIYTKLGWTNVIEDI